MKKWKKYIGIIIIILLLIFFGYFRDTTFKSINALLQAWDADMDYEVPFYLRFIKSYEYETIVNLKWLLTLLFSLVYLAIAFYTISLLFSNRSFAKITIAAYLVIIAISALFIITGLVFNSSSQKMYEFARYFMGLAQSPVILMILIPVFKIYEKEKSPDLL